MKHTFERILVAVDGSDQGFAALKTAIALGADGACEIVCCCAVDVSFVLSEAVSAGYISDPTPIIDAMRSEGQAFLAEATRRAAIARRTVSTVIVLDSSVAAILTTAEVHTSDLIIMGAGRRSLLDRLVLGSTAEGVLRGCAIPVMTVHTSGTWDRLAHIFAAIDESEPSSAAIDIAIDLAMERNARLTLCTVAPKHFIEATARMTKHVQDARRRGVFADYSIVLGDPSTEILKKSATVTASLIVLGSHGRAGLQRLLLGSVAERVVRDSVIPVLVIRTGKLARC